MVNTDKKQDESENSHLEPKKGHNEKEAISLKIKAKLSTRQSEEVIEDASKEEEEDQPSTGDYKLSEEEIEKYGRFTENQKRVFLAIASFSSLLGPFSSSSYMPAVDKIAEQFNTTGSIINLTGTIFNIMSAISPCLFNPMYGYYGIRPMFIFSSLLLLITSILSASAQNLAMFFVFRSLTGLFSYIFINMSGSICGHIYEPTRRSKAMAICLTGTLSATAFAPVIAGVIITYNSWRIIFWIQAGISGIVLISSLLYLKETSPQVEFAKWQEETGKRFKLILINPFNVILALRVPTLLLMGLTTLGLSYNFFALLTPIRYVVDPRFGFTTPIDGSLFYLAPGTGMFLSTFVSGRYCDWVLKKWVSKRKGKLISEDRLRSAWTANVVMIVSIIIYGWALEKEKGGMALPIICMFINGFAQTFIFTAVNSYCVGSLPEIGSPIALGSNYFARNVGSSIGSGITLPMFDGIGIGWSSTVSGFLMTGSLFCIVFCSLYGYDIRLRWLDNNGFEVKDPAFVLKKRERDVEKH